MAEFSPPKCPPTGFTVTFLKSLKPAPKGQRYSVVDNDCRHLRVRVTDTGAKTFIMYKRWPGLPNPLVRALGDVDVLSLKEAREKAQAWEKLRKSGIDPKKQEADDKRQRAMEEEERQDTLFGVVMEDYLKRHVAGQRKAEQVAREMRADLLPRLKNKPLADITRRDVTKVIDAIKDRGSPYQAHNVFGHLRTMFNWAIDRGVYGIETSPCDRMKATRVIGPKKARQRVLSDLEIAAFWRAAGKMTKYDRVRRVKVDDINGAVFRLLLVTGQRKSEIAEMAWSEIDGGTKLLTVPAERYKSDAAHTVPLSEMAMDIIEPLPRYKGKDTGDFVFTTTKGKKPVNGFSNAKERLERQMLLALRALARMRGDDPKAVRMDPFVIHDVRRTVRTRLSGLRVPDHVAELVIGHARRGLAGVYDRHSYDAEKREALDAWANRLRSIIEPVPSNVVPFREVAS